MVLNPALHLALRQRFGAVRVTNENQRRVASRSPGANEESVVVKGEAYDISCPFCGDRRQRCSVSYAWLSRGSDGRPRTDLIHCYNEGCRGFYKKVFWGDFEEAVRSGAAMARMAEIVAPPPPPPEPMRLPNGCVPLHELPRDHVAHEFIRTKYGGNLDPEELGREYGALWTEAPDDRFPFAANRVIFPIYNDGKLISWQGRTVNPHEKKIRWYLPPGFRKTIYRFDAVPPNTLPVLAEGITSAISSSQSGLAIFGKTLDEVRAKLIAGRWVTAVIALDPEACVPCLHNVKEGQEPPKSAAEVVKGVLDQYLHWPSIIIEWPPEILAIARDKNLAINKNNKDIKVPDAGDLGRPTMRNIIEQTVARQIATARRACPTTKK